MLRCASCSIQRLPQFGVIGSGLNLVINAVDCTRGEQPLSLEDQPNLASASELLPVVRPGPGGAAGQVKAAEGKLRHSPLNLLKQLALAAAASRVRRLSKRGHPSGGQGKAWAGQKARRACGAARTWIERTSPCWMPLNGGVITDSKLGDSRFSVLGPNSVPRGLSWCTRRADKIATGIRRVTAWALETARFLAAVAQRRKQRRLGEVLLPGPSADNAG